MIRYLSFLICLCLSVFALNACQGYESYSNEHPQLVAEPDAVSAMLADAADRASNALQTLAAVEHHKSPGVAVNPVGDAPTSLRRAVTVNWVGSVEPITKTLADRASYNFVTVGRPPSVPIVVSIDAENKPVIEVLRDIGLQLGLRADVRVDGDARVVEIHYPPAGGIGG